jgi:hypothetical protein
LTRFERPIRPLPLQLVYVRFGMQPHPREQFDPVRQFDDDNYRNLLARVIAFRTSENLGSRDQADLPIFKTKMLPACHNLNIFRFVRSSLI